MSVWGSNSAVRSACSEGPLAARMRRQLVGQEWLKVPDTVEEVWFEVIAAVQISCRDHAGERRLASGHCDRRRRRDQHGELAEVLGGCGEMELVAGAVWSAQSQPIELQDAFQMRKQHLDLFALTARGPVHLGLGDVARHIAGALVDGARDLASGRVRTALRLE